MTFDTIVRYSDASLKVPLEPVNQIVSHNMLIPILYDMIQCGPQAFCCARFHKQDCLCMSWGWKILVSDLKVNNNIPLHGECELVCEVETV